MKTLGYKTIGVAVKTSFCNFKCAIQGEVFPRMKRHCSFPDSGREVRGHTYIMVDRDLGFPSPQKCIVAPSASRPSYRKTVLSDST